MKKQNLEDLLINDTIDNNPSILHKMMQLSTFSYIERKHDLSYADAEFPLYIYRRKLNYAINEEDKKHLKTDKWNADIILRYEESGKKICEIVEVETINADELLHHRQKNIMKKISIVERAYDAKALNKIFEDVDEVRFSLSLNSVRLDENQRYRTAKKISNNIIQSRNNGYKNESINLYKIYMLKDDLWDYCKDSEEKELLMYYNQAMRKNIWKIPLKEVLKQLYTDLDDKKLDSLYERHYFKK